MRSACCSALLALLPLAGCGDTQTHLLPPGSIVNDTIPEPLTRIAGDAGAGADIFVSRDGGHCILCHQVDGLDAPFQGDVGPALTGVGSRLSPGQIRLRIVDYEVFRPGVLMPSYYRTHALYQVSDTNAGQPILPAQSVEDLVAYLSTLKD
ncbi:sulfur oxidation c-type cytochrome SoxX [Hyphomonas johnsonii]|uniref:Putative sulfur oxidation cytochrome SoxX n=1 Tax=Hyphomonas johnsonii MHS-2 TaxID=1280950 RepID=A0A059FUE6_9PROT|nr:sulfur oxidation c-type cytochrome SoxX [Hyphomonas johnsonii]KCZ94121.1 putative sulfur oxidation cytochrome SoxX [Hyphomonas johnsonii MHS-2]